MAEFRSATKHGLVFPNSVTSERRDAFEIVAGAAGDRIIRPALHTMTDLITIAVSLRSR